MGLLISADDAAPVPRQTMLTLTCDGDHGLFPAEPATFSTGNFMTQMHEAVVLGWKESYRNGVRLFLCPACSGK